MIRITAFRWVPPFAQGLVKDLRPRWALEEAQIPYEVRLIDREDQATPAYRKQQPFGQVPTIDDGDLNLFESGSIVLHIAEKSAILLPDEISPRARAKSWVFAAINSMEPSIQNLATIDLFNADAAWAIERRPAAVEMVRDRLEKLNVWLADREYLEDDRFTAGDLMMTTVLRNLRHLDILAKDFPRLAAYKERCEARPAFVRALTGQMETFAKNVPRG